MRITTRGRYALRMMIDIAERGENERIPIKEISERQGISVKYLEQIVPSLKRAGLLRSGRGSSGGYTLTRAPEQYTVGEILRAIEGKLVPVACLEDDVNRCERTHSCKTLDFWMGLHRVIEDYVDSVTLKEIAERGNFNDGGWDFCI